MKSLCATVIVVSTALLGAQGQTGMAEWPYVGGEQSHSKYSPLSDINRSNVNDLEIAWQWDASEMPLPGIRRASWQLPSDTVDDRQHVVCLDHVLARGRPRCRDRCREVGLRPEGVLRRYPRGEPGWASTTVVWRSGGTATTCIFFSIVGLGSTRSMRRRSS